MADHRSTSIGGSRRSFPATEWTQLQNIKGLGEEAQREVVERILGRYWKPVYCFIRQKGYDNESAKDLTQGFFCDIVMRRQLFSQAKRSQGKFRTFLLSALNCYLTDQYRRANAKKRTPEAGIQAITEDHNCVIPSELARSSPETMFQYQWAADLLDQAIQMTKRICLSKDQGAHWQVFREKTLKPILEDCKAPSYRQICAELDQVSEQQAQNMEFRVRRRFGKVIHDLLKKQISDSSDVESELNELLAIFSKMGT